MEKSSKISDGCWNSSGSILAVSFFVDNHIGPCSHQGLISFYKFNSSSKKIESYIEVDTNSCVKSLDSHPKNSNLFVCGSYSGEVYLIDLTNQNTDTDSDPIKFISKIDSYLHKDCVNFVKWVKNEEGKYVR
jgi:hypothetical protein